MAYSDFTLDQLRTDFGIQLVQVSDLFPHASPLVPSEWLTTYLNANKPLVRALGSEKASSELIVAPVLVEARLQSGGQCGFFTGIEMIADAARGLRGYCDFVISRTPLQYALEAPLLLIVEAKRGDLASGYGQCAAGMLGAQIFNEKHEHPMPAIYGVVTSGEAWTFLRLADTTLTFDAQPYTIDDVAKILGILKFIIGA